MFCATFLKFGAVLFLETTQSDQSSFPMNVGNHFPRWKEWQCWATFSARKKCLTRTLFYSLYFIEGLARKISTFSAEINQSESRPYINTHTHTHTHARAHVVAFMELGNVLLSCNSVVSQTFLCVQNSFQGKMSGTLRVKTCTEQSGSNGNPSNLYSGSARFKIAPGRYGFSLFPSFLYVTSKVISQLSFLFQYS
jgi:hypothetical protein